MIPSSEACVGMWYAGERHTGALLVIDRDASSGLIHLRGADGRRVRMTFATWSRWPLAPAQSDHEVPDETHRFEWNEPAIG